MEKVLLVSGSEKGRSLLSPPLQEAGFGVYVAEDGAQARQLLELNRFALILLNMPLADESSTALAIWAAEHTDAGVILLAPEECADAMSEALDDYGVFVVEKPVSRKLFHQVLKLSLVARKRLLGLNHQNAKLQGKIEEMKLVDRAKCVLIQYLNMTEPQAHRYIEKQAMDMRMTRREIAEGILKTYEN